MGGKLVKRIGYQFSDPGLLEAALRHRSLGARHNERLEFLGDSVLGLAVSEMLFAKYPDASEGELTRLRARLVRQATLATVAPGISEALVATAMGLFAAIPAVMAYNRFSARADSLSGKYETFSDEFYSILHRQAHTSPAAQTAQKSRG